MRLSSPCARASSSRRRGITSLPLRFFAASPTPLPVLILIPLRMILLLPVNSSTGDSLRPRTLLILRYFHHVYDITRLANLINFLNLRFLYITGKRSPIFGRLLYLFAVLETVLYIYPQIISLKYYIRSQRERETLYFL